MAELTICILSAVERPLPDCLDAVARQEGGPYPVVKVHDVCPMAAAFNAMIAQCPTRFIVQVDGDVVLHPWAVRVLRQTIGRHPWSYAAWGQLYQEGWGLGGAVRIWRRWPVHLLRFRDVRCVDRNLHRRMRWLLLGRVQATHAGEPFGTHRPHSSDFAAYSKSKNDVLKWRVVGRQDLIEEALAHRDLERAFDWARMGAVMGMRQKPERSKNAALDYLEYLAINEARRDALPMGNFLVQLPPAGI